jgi:hypothetical protein
MTTIIGGSVPNITFSDGTTQNSATSGGTVSSAGGYTIHTFTSSGIYTA